MSEENKILDSYNYKLSSSTEIKDIIKKISDIKCDNILIHIVSLVHNTVLVQNLKKELTLLFPSAKIVLMKHQDRMSTALNIFTYDRDVGVEDAANYMLEELYFENLEAKSQIQEYRNKLFNKYFTDHLTNLPNVYQLRKDLDENEEYGLVIFNIDNFQIINNFYGFIVGDYVIEKVGEYLKEHIKNSSIYRLSGDEFAFVLDKKITFYELKEYLNNIYESMKDMYVEYQNLNIFVNFTLASTAKIDNKNIFSNVLMALKYAKQMGLPYWIYEDRMQFEDEYERNIELSGIVRSAVEQSKIIPYFQAIINTKTSKIEKYECLARLVDEDEKILSPVLFIPIAKKIKVYSMVTTTVIDKSFETFENSEYEFSINLSIEDIMSSQIFKFIIEKLKTSKASTRVTFEILESDAIEDFKKVERFISEAKRYGAKIAIDDFGSGYSNFSYLTKMSPDFIKIDGSLIKDIDVDKNAFIVVETIVEFSKKLGIKTIAEYVHSSTIMDKVKELDIDYAQGFYLDEPSLLEK